MIAREKIDHDLARLPGGAPRGDFTAQERADVAAALTRRFPGFELAAGRSKADAVGDLVAFLLARQGKARK